MAPLALLWVTVARLLVVRWLWTFTVRIAPQRDCGQYVKWLYLIVSLDIKSLFHQGTRAYQSLILILGSGYPQDHQDDLESFLYVLASICCRYNGPNIPFSEHIAALPEFEHSSDSIASNARLGFLQRPVFYLAPFFQNRKVFVTLFDQLARLCISWFQRKCDHWMDLRAKHRHAPDGTSVDPRDHLDSIAVVHLQDVNNQAKGQLPAQDHNAFLTIIDEAIERQEQTLDSGMELPDTPATPEPFDGKSP